MRKKITSVAAALLVAGAFTASAQENGNPFRVQGDNGEIVKVLPPQANAQANKDPQPVDAVQSGTSVYPGSYGSGPLLNHGGKIIQTAKFLAVFYDSTIPANISSGINSFINTFGGSNDYNIITQYTGSNGSISNSIANAGQLIDHAGVPRSISDAGVQSYLAGLFNAGRLSANATTIYGVYLPNGTKSTLGSSASCRSYCGYHSHFTYNGIQVKYAVFPYLTCSGCSLSGKSVLDMLTIVTSHEIREAVTDPGDNNTDAWYDSTGYEADDKCAWHNLYQLSNGSWVQPEYSNRDGGCVVFP